MGLKVQGYLVQQFFEWPDTKAVSKVSTAIMRELLYTDICDMLTGTQDKMHNLMDCVSGACTAFDLTINVNKTAFMYQPVLSKRFEDPAIFLYGERLKVVDPFVNLRNILVRDNSLDREISFM